MGFIYLGRIFGVNSMEEVVKHWFQFNSTNSFAFEYLPFALLIGRAAETTFIQLLINELLTKPSIKPMESVPRINICLGGL